MMYVIQEWFDRPPQEELLTVFHFTVNKNIHRVSFKDEEDFQLIDSIYRNENIRDC